MMIHPLFPSVRDLLLHVCMYVHNISLYLTSIEPLHRVVAEAKNTLGAFLPHYRGRIGCRNRHKWGTGPLLNSGTATS